MNVSQLIIPTQEEEFKDPEYRNTAVYSVHHPAFRADIEEYFEHIDDILNAQFPGTIEGKDLQVTKHTTEDGINDIVFKQDGKTVFVLRAKAGSAPMVYASTGELSANGVHSTFSWFSLEDLKAITAKQLEIAKKNLVKQGWVFQGGKRASSRQSRQSRQSRNRKRSRSNRRRA